ncbi:hypothetical protein OKW43_006770 [Paraburkholderia sp. WC7.3g]
MGVTNESPELRAVLRFPEDAGYAAVSFACRASSQSYISSIGDEKAERRMTTTVRRPAACAVWWHHASMLSLAARPSRIYCATVLTARKLDPQTDPRSSNLLRWHCIAADLRNYFRRYPQVFHRLDAPVDQLLEKMRLAAPCDFRQLRQSLFDRRLHAYSDHARPVLSLSSKPLLLMHLCAADRRRAEYGELPTLCRWEHRHIPHKAQDYPHFCE